MKYLDFETSEPLFSLKEVNDLISFTAMILVEANKKKSLTFKEWADYIDHWTEVNCTPEEIKSHLYDVIIPSLNTMKRHE